MQAAVEAADSEATITICPGTYPGAVSIQDNNLALVGAGMARIRLTAGPNTNILTADAGESEEVVRNLTVAGAQDVPGIVNFGTLTLSGCTVADNHTGGSGGGIENNGTLTLAASVVRDNEAGGGGIWTFGPLRVAAGTTITNNTATDHGGGMDNGGALTVTAGAVITGNMALVGGGMYIHPSGTTTLEPGATVASNQQDDCVTFPGGMLDGDCPTSP